MIENSSGCRIVIFYVIFQLVLLAITGSASTQLGSETVHSELSKSLKQFLRSFYHGKSTKYIASFEDLNGDGKPEAIVYLMGEEWCGSGGCNTLILLGDSDSWKVLSNITITRHPIYVLSNTSNGWHNIGIWVQGGGIQSGYEAELKFDGRTYPANPSLSPALCLEDKSSGEVIISSVGDALFLYDQ